MPLDNWYRVDGMRTRLRICRTKISFADRASALIVAQMREYLVRPYQCDRCRQWHLTSRRKGKRIPRPV
jgi:hypothetical protein